MQSGCGECRALVWVGERALLAVAAPLPHESACGLGDSVVVLSLKWMSSLYLPKVAAAWADVQGTPTWSCYRAHVLMPC